MSDKNEDVSIWLWRSRVVMTVINENIVRRGSAIFVRERTCTRDENGDCTQCGRHLSLEARYCKHCGAKAVKK